MIDDNISMEEDTELRELVVQTLENNGVLAKVRAELRASVFLTLEEQESVLNPEPFLNKSVKQYLSSSQGKILFSLVREFLEYFGLDYTMSVYDPETYCGKEYNYMGRQKLSEEFGIDSKEPLLGELLKNILNSALNHSHKLVKKSYINEPPTPDRSTEKVENVTFDVSVPTVSQKESISNCNLSIEEAESESGSNMEMPINVTIKKKQNDDATNKKATDNLVSTISKPSTYEINRNLKQHREKDHLLENVTYQSNSLKDQINSNINCTADNQSDVTTNQETHQNKISLMEFHTANNLRNIKQAESSKKTGKTIFFDEIIVDGVKEKLPEAKDDKLLLDNLPPLPISNNSIFGDLPPLNGKKANIDDLKEILDMAEGVSYNEEDLSSASGSASDQSPQKEKFTSKSPETYINKQYVLSENESEEIDEEICSNTSCLDNSPEKTDKIIVVDSNYHKN
ncbi:uncharacterized protein LOC106645548 [Copidosoma floridanum]|uniref:uncharacterized protein LOC106645548 n=1 Tax=Copidosoma floridanum TaxID=29053 RepID=UPI0006C9DEF3|nr:uncharacterized protein LOC106645548 [Copidosoma floridanum]